MGLEKRFYTDRINRRPPDAQAAHLRRIRLEKKKEMRQKRVDKQSTLW